MTAVSTVPREKMLLGRGAFGHVELIDGQPFVKNSRSFKSLPLDQSQPNTFCRIVLIKKPKFYLKENGKHLKHLFIKILCKCLIFEKRLAIIVSIM